MRWVRPQVFLIGKTAVNRDGYQNWLKSHRVSPETEARILDTDKTDAEMIVEGAGRRCYMSFQPGLNPNVSKIREDITQYVDNILASGHGSVIESVSFSFAIENVSRVFTGEMNRHRAGMAISEGSMRYIRFSDIPIVEVPSLRLDDELLMGDVAEKIRSTRKIIEATCAVVENAYKQLADEVWKSELAPESKFKDKKNVTSMLRRIVPMGVATGGVWTMNLRTLRHVCTMRCSAAAEEEILEVASMILDVMRAAESSFFSDFSKGEDGYWKPKYNKV